MSRPKSLHVALSDDQAALVGRGATILGLSSPEMIRMGGMVAARVVVGTADALRRAGEKPAELVALVRGMKP